MKWSPKICASKYNLIPWNWYSLGVKSTYFPHDIFVPSLPKTWASFPPNLPDIAKIGLKHTHSRFVSLYIVRTFGLFQIYLRVIRLSTHVLSYNYPHERATHVNLVINKYVSFETNLFKIIDVWHDWLMSYTFSLHLLLPIWPYIVVESQLTKRKLLSN